MKNIYETRFSIGRCSILNGSFTNKKDAIKEAKKHNGAYVIKVVRTLVYKA